MKSIVTLVAALAACIVHVNAQFDVHARTTNSANVIQFSDQTYYQLDSTLTYIDNNSLWIQKGKSYYAYDNNKRLSGFLFQTFDSNEWINSKKTTYSYSEDNSSWEKNDHIWHSLNSEWQNLSQKQYIQNRSTGELDVLFSKWESNSWDKKWQQKQTYDSEGRLATYNTVRWNNESNEKENYWNYVCHYDNEGKLIQITNKSFDTKSNQWTDEWECIHEYNNSGNRTHEQIIDWDNDSEQWNNLTTQLIDHSEANKIVKTKQNWNDEFGSWSNNMRITETFNQLGKLSEVSREYWDITSNDWIPHRIDIYTFNEDGIKTEAATFYWNKNTSEWNNHVKTAYHYSKISDSENDDKEQNTDLVIFPNPAQSEIYLKFSGEAKDLKIISMDGAVVLQELVPSIYRSVNISRLRSGMYIAIISFGDTQASMKFIKK